MVRDLLSTSDDYSRRCKNSRILGIFSCFDTSSTAGKSEKYIGRGPQPRL